VLSDEYPLSVLALERERGVAVGPAVLDVVAVPNVVTVRAERVSGSGRDEEHGGARGQHGGRAKDPALHLLSFLASVHSNCMTPAAAGGWVCGSHQIFGPITAADGSCSGAFARTPAAQATGPD